MNAYANDLSSNTIQAQKNDQQLCIDTRLPECVKKCEHYSNQSIHCHGLCQLNISNDCRYAGE